MSESSKGIHPERLKSFVRHVCIVAKKHRDREKARSELQGQIKRLKRFSSKKKEMEMDEELKELNRKISFVLEKEAQLLRIGKEESAASKDLMYNVVNNRDKINQMNESIRDIKERLKDYIELKTEREKKINKLEKKIRAKTEKKKDVSLLKNKLKSLEALYNKLKKKGVDISRVESRIEDLKLRLMV